MLGVTRHCPTNRTRTLLTTIWLFISTHNSNEAQKTHTMPVQQCKNSIGQLQLRVIACVRILSSHTGKTLARSNMHRKTTAKSASSARPWRATLAFFYDPAFAPHSSLARRRKVLLSLHHTVCVHTTPRLFVGVFPKHQIRHFSFAFRDAPSWREIGTTSSLFRWAWALTVISVSKFSSECLKTLW